MTRVKGCTLAEVTGVLEALASIHTRWWMNRKLEAIPVASAEVHGCARGNGCGIHGCLAILPF